MGHTSIEQHRIDTRDSRPIKQAPRRLSLHLKEKAEVVVRKMLAKDVIEPSTSPCSSPVVLVRKKDGTTRFCVDYCKVNSVHQFARDHLRVESQQQKRLYDHRSHTNSYREGRRYGCTTHKKKRPKPKIRDSMGRTLDGNQASYRCGLLYPEKSQGETKIRAP